MPTNKTPNYAHAASLAGLFHDFGKGNQLFQKKLKIGKGSEPYRHEWLSAQMFLNLVDGKTDTEWLSDLSSESFTELDRKVTSIGQNEGLDFSKASKAPLAKLVSWLILSHHHLPKDNLHRNNDISNAENWLSSKLDSSWNSLNHTKDCFGEREYKENLRFKHGSPFMSPTWRQEAKKVSKQCLIDLKLLDNKSVLNSFHVHMARLTLMLADHAYSSSEANSSTHSAEYNVYANTDSQGCLKQHLDEHCIGVSRNSIDAAQQIAELSSTAKKLKLRSIIPKADTPKHFLWQDNAYNLACDMSKKANEFGFFGVNIASTGTGKTYANAQIMQGLSISSNGARYSVALGLRSLTIQTSDNLKESLSLKDDEIATIIGGLLPESNQSIETGSESSSPLIADSSVIYQTSHVEEISGLLHNDPKITKLIKAPITVSTVDQLIGASEGISGGKQIAPLLRLLNSDLILDEVDDYSLEDTPALSRLVYFAGLMGSKVLISSATIPPSIVASLFLCYYQGRKAFNEYNGLPAGAIQTGFFDEFSTKWIGATDMESVKSAFQSFAETKSANITSIKSTSKLGSWLDTSSLKEPKHLFEHLAELIHNKACELSKEHKTICSTGVYASKTVSAGIVRIANIQPLTEIAEQLLLIPSPDNTRIHYCFYHSQHPLFVRSEIEKNLDSLLKRSKTSPEEVFTNEIVETALTTTPEKHHVFIVVASPVAEVGRDHDYDWAIIEPSSSRSIIQTSGRVQRHREIPVNTANIFVLDRNIKAIKGEEIAYSRPGFESEKSFRLTKNGGHAKCLVLQDKCLSNSPYNHSWLKRLDASVRNIEPPKKSLIRNGKAAGIVELEHLATNLSVRDYVTPWATTPCSTMFGELQMISPFRNGSRQIEFCLHRKEPNDSLEFYQIDKANRQLVKTPLIKLLHKEAAHNSVSVWGYPTDVGLCMKHLENRFELTPEDTHRHFGMVSLPEYNIHKGFVYSPWLGVRLGKS
ncbi:type I-F CRISPR-associated helicase Cas3f [Vibrio sp. D431a]|uniref:type I-F CRISPR-associated helicase Cas3f n=1 Tax=Vibrio sp. D431a TaxID=2837388 RepID=UPI0025549381|nr:type I-F CRISPR-associated helicase Cas3f [Vibrio sp. D431a]MDK9790066.1 type I-F CRISPR-associated helicase Cas3 [Vibrio sp. D431a]